MANTFKFLLFVLSLSAVLSLSSYNVVNTERTSSSITLYLNFTGTSDYYIKPTSPHIKQLKFVFSMYTFSEFNIKITDANKPRYELPQGGALPEDPFKNFTYPIYLGAVDFEYTESPFDFKVTRKGNNATIFSTYDKNFIFSDYYIEIGTKLDSSFIYGLGLGFSESFRKRSGKWTFYNQETQTIIDDNAGRGRAGHYPVYLLRERGNYFHYNYLRSSQAMDIVVSAETNSYLQYKIIGGILDFRFILGDTNPEATLQKWNYYTGPSAIPPFWSLGAHQSRAGYKNVTVLQNVINNYEQYDIPLDGIWLDFDYLINNQPFILNQVSFPLNSLKNVVKDYKLMVLLLGANLQSMGIPYLNGLKRNAYLKTAKGNEFQLRAMSMDCVQIDMLHPNSSALWYDLIDTLYQKIPYTGLWIAMGDFNQDCNGTCPRAQQESGGFDFSKDLPYQPGNKGNIESNQVSLNASHYGGIKEAEAHAYLSNILNLMTYQNLAQKSPLPFLLAKGGSVGANRHSFFWTGDNKASYDFLKSSIADNFNFQLYGVQMAGPDVCGYSGDTTSDLCIRWYQLGSLYPFMRNHNKYGAISQQPYALGPVMLQAAKINLRFRYSILKHYYTLFVTKKGTGSIFRPLFFAFPNDDIVYQDDVCDTQFMIGNDLLAAPIVEGSKNYRQFYLPNPKWYNFHTGEYLSSGYQNITVNQDDKVPLFLKWGAVVLVQNTTAVRQTKQLNNRFNVVAGMQLDMTNSTVERKFYNCSGKILSIQDYNDEQIVTDCIKTGCTYELIFGMLVEGSTPKILELEVKYGGGKNLNQSIYLENISIFFQFAKQVRTFTTPVPINDSDKFVFQFQGTKLDQIVEQ